MYMPSLSYLNVLDHQVNLDDDDEVPLGGLELHGGPDDQDADGNYYMGGVTFFLVIMDVDLICEFST